MAVYVDVNWFYSDNDVLNSTDRVKISDTISREHLENISKNFRFDDIYMVLKVRDDIIDYILNSEKHKYFTARVVDKILTEMIEIESEF